MADHEQIGGTAPNMPLTPSSTFSSPQSSNQGQGEAFALLHAVIISLITTVGGYVQFQFQSKKSSLFDEHGSIMRAVFGMLLLYGMGLLAELKLQNQSKYLAIMKQFTPLFGLLVVVLLLFVLSLFLGLAASILWAFLAIGPTINLFQECLRSMFQEIPANPANSTRNFNMEERESIGIQDNDLPVEASFGNQNLSVLIGNRN